ncbi:unnamed protein product [Xylocopa violacea]|uniref:Ionotropic receptor 75a N-terminal domain-containing protein n=1 Tax=Xylocopa violacea TaxID=135666 RepID=A0ABP1P059_XYLVO
MYITYISMLNSAVDSRLDVKKVLRAEYHRLGVFLDSRCDRRRYTRILVDATRYSMYDEMHKWLILGSNLSHILDTLDDDAFSVSTDVVIAVPSADNYTLLLYEWTKKADLFYSTEIVQINALRRFDNSGPVFFAFKKNLIDISASPVAMKIDRLSNGDIIGPVWPIRSCFMFRTISSTKVKPDQFLQPLSVKVWYVILAMIGAVMAILIMFLRLEGVRGPAEIYGLSVLLTIGALSQQGSAFVPSRCAARIAYLQVLFCSLIILNYYSASVVSNRLKNKGEKMNDSLITLAKSNLKLAVEPAPYIRSFLRVPDKEVRYFYDNRWTKIPESEKYLPLDEGLNHVAKGLFAYHAMVDTAYPYIEHSFNYRSICELTEVHLFRGVLAFYARRRSSFTELMKVGLTKIRNVGIQKRELIRWGARKPFCPNNLLIAEPLSIQEAAPVIIFLCISVMLSILICIVENIIFCIVPPR